MEQVTERLTGDYFDDMQKITRHYAKSNNIDLNTGGNDFQDIIDKLSEYETAEDEGRLVVLPCKNWLDIVFGEQELFYGIDMDYIENPIREITVHNEERFTWYDGWKTVVLKGVDENGLDWEFAPEEIGKTVFLTRDEAEKTLKEMEGKS
ncbi:hypothetical protein [Bacteroides clarus]|uniref:hypothetical protein n=1 Tax=Bacteroides clarus TaxID=626929 RepID=UPI00248EEBDC|nr:hypothetical protein [Bacteroides clarus]